MHEWAGVELALLAALAAWALLRTTRVQLLARRASTVGPDSRVARVVPAQRSPIDAARGPSNDRDVDAAGPGMPFRRATAEGAAAGFAIPAQALWELSRIDPAVISAVSAAGPHAGGMAAVEDSYRGFLGYVADNGAMLDTPGFTSRLLGYVGEQQAADTLTEQGHMVVMATSANNPGWDLLVDGVQANVKTYRDASQALAHADADPDTLFLINGDATHQSARENVEYLPGLSWGQANADLTGSLAAGHALTSGDFLGDAMLGGVPVTLLGFSVYRQVRAVRAGKRIRHATADAAVDVVVRGTGVLLGAKTGAMSGGLVDVSLGGSSLGAGSVIGGIVGATMGSVAGAAGVRWVKGRPLRQAQHELHKALTLYGAAYHSDRLGDRLAELIEAPAVRSRDTTARLALAHKTDRASFRWWAWPGADQVLRREALRHGRDRAAMETLEADRQVRTWRALLDDPDADTKIGLTFANGPALAAQLGDVVANPAEVEIRLKDVEGAVIRAEDARRRLGSQ